MPSSLSALTVIPINAALAKGVLFRVTTPPIAPLLAGLFGEQALLALQLVAGLNPSGNPDVDGAGLVRADELPQGAGAGWILSPFVRSPGPGNRSRFSDGTYGVWYGADSLATAQAEVGYHLARWLAKTQATPDRLER
ncbi:MAG: RES family NAD+ phosphorylase, partial [Gemmatimonadaceae bacterium]